MHCPAGLEALEANITSINPKDQGNFAHRLQVFRERLGLLGARGVQVFLEEHDCPVLYVSEGVHRTNAAPSMDGWGYSQASAARALECAAWPGGVMLCCAQEDEDLKARTNCSSCLAGQLDGTGRIILSHAAG